jgi:hypothetical protein
LWHSRGEHHMFRKVFNLPRLNLLVDYLGAVVDYGAKRMS